MAWRNGGAAVLAAALLAGCQELPGGGGGVGGIAFGRGFVFVRGDERDIHVADESNYLAVGRLTTSGGNRYPSLSADGRQAVFAHTDAAGVSSIMTVATSGGGAPRTVYVADTAAGQKSFANPVFSPDGTTLVFTYEIFGTTYVAKVSAVDGSGFDTLSAAPSSYASPSFFPAAVRRNEVLVAVGSSAGQYTRLERINIGSGQISPVTNNLGPEVASISGRAVLSPDGTRVAFDARLAGTGGTRIFVHTLASGSTTRVSDASAGSAEALHGFPTWVSTSEVAFTSNEGGADHVYIQDVSAAGTGTLTVPAAVQPWFGP